MKVLKFGGTSLSTPDKIKAIAKKLAEIHNTGEKLIVVVSAMGSTTDELTRLAHEVSPNPHSRELDMLMTAGERVSMALLCMALNDLNCSAISFTGSQAGIFTDSSHQGAKIIDIKPIRVDEALAKNQIVVLAGFQGVDPRTKEITTLGRGGSDTTAVALSAHFNLKTCEMYKDVIGVYSEDPNKYKDAQFFPQISWDQLLELCNKGAQVVHKQAVELAKEKNIEIAVGLAESFEIGTRVNGESS